MRLHAERPSRQHAGGFSLLEMLVAMAILAMVVAGLLNVAGEATRTATRMEDRILAGIVADNIAAEALLAEPPSLARPAQGETVLGDRRWRWERSSASTNRGQQALVRVDIRVLTTDGGEAAQTWIFR